MPKHAKTALTPSVFFSLKQQELEVKVKYENVGMKQSATTIVPEILGW